MIENLWRFAFIFDLILIFEMQSWPILCMLWLFTCHDKCKFVARAVCYFLYQSNLIWIISLCSIFETAPWCSVSRAEGFQKSFAIHCVSAPLNPLVKLSHWSRDQMASNLLTTSSNAFPWMTLWNLVIKISPTFVPKESISNTPALVQIMAWHRPGN